MRVWADFNGLFGDILCLSHDDTCTDEHGNVVRLIPGLVLTALEVDEDEFGNPDSLIATGVVEPAPPDLACLGSRWVLRIDHKGVRHESELNDA